jgi:hypothetical protein
MTLNTSKRKWNLSRVVVVVVALVVVVLVGWVLYRRLASAAERELIELESLAEAVASPRVGLHGESRDEPAPPQQSDTRRSMKTDDKAAQNLGCNDACHESSQCSTGMFCCPNHHVCMDSSTGGTWGPACNK